MSQPTLTLNGATLEKIEADPRDAKMYLPSQRKFTTQREQETKARKSSFDFWKMPGEGAKIRFFEDVSGSMSDPYPKTNLCQEILNPYSGNMFFDLESYCGTDFAKSEPAGTLKGMYYTRNGAQEIKAEPAVTKSYIDTVMAEMKALAAQYEIKTITSKAINPFDPYDPTSLTEDFYFPNHAINPFISTKTKAKMAGLDMDALLSELKETNDTVWTGQRYFDETIGGFEPGVITALVGPAASGLTTLSMDLALQLVKQGKRILYTSFERSEADLDRVMVAAAMKAGVDANDANHDVVVGNRSDIDNYVEEVNSVMAIGPGEAFTALFIDRVEDFPADRDVVLNKLRNLGLKHNIPVIVTSQTLRSRSFEGEDPSWPVANMRLAMMAHKIITLKNHKGIEVEMKITKDRNAMNTGARCFFDLKDHEYSL